MRQPTSDKVREAIINISIEDGESRPEAILEKLANEDGFLEDDLPGERTVYRIIAEVRGKYTAEQRALDQPWQIRPNGVEGVDRDAIPILLRLIKANVLEPGWHDPLTIRMARWVSVLAPALKDTPTSWWAHTASLYARRERWAAIHDEKLDTSDLDAWVAICEVGSSDEDIERYNRGVIEGWVPSITTEATLRDLYAGQPGKAQEAMKRVAANWENFKQQQGSKEGQPYTKRSRRLKQEVEDER